MRSLIAALAALALVLTAARADDTLEYREYTTILDGGWSSSIKGVVVKSAATGAETDRYVVVTMIAVNYGSDVRLDVNAILSPEDTVTLASTAADMAKLLERWKKDPPEKGTLSSKTIGKIALVAYMDGKKPVIEVQGDFKYDTYRVYKGDKDVATLVTACQLASDFTHRTGRYAPPKPKPETPVPSGA